MTMKEGSYGYARIFNFKDQDGNPISLAEFDTVTLTVKVGDIIKTFDCDVIDAENGKVQYITQKDDFDTPGIAYMEVDAESSNALYISENKIKETIKKRIKE